MRAWISRTVLVLALAMGLVFGLAAAPALAVDGGSIQGHVTDSVTGLPAGQSCIVHIWNTTTWGVYQWVVLDPEGYYRFDGLTAGDYMCWISDTASPPTHIEYNPECNANPPFATLATDDESLTVDVQMRPYSHITGHVSAKSDGHALSGIGVAAYRFVNGVQAGGSGSASTDASGNYDIGGLTPGTWHVVFADPKTNSDPANSYESFIWPNITYGGPYPDAASGQDVTITADGDVASGIDAQLTRFSRVKMTVTDWDGNPATGLTWSYYHDPTLGWIGWHSQNYPSVYECCAVGAEYKFEFRDNLEGHYFSFYPSTVLWSEATTFTIDAEGTTYELTQKVFGPSTISGRVTSAQDATGVPFAGVTLEMLDAGGWVTPYYVGAQTGTMADSTGNWSMQVAPGIYRIRFTDPNGLFEPAYLSSTPGVPRTTVVAVETTLTGLDQTLLPLDTTAPHTTPTYSDAWTNGIGHVSLVASDGPGGSGVASTWYRLGSDGTTSAYAPGSTIDVSAEGTTTVYFGSVDVAGHAEETQTAMVRVDHTPPTAAIRVAKATGQAVVTLTASDTLSGVAAIVCRVDRASRDTTYALPFKLSWGTHTVAYRAVDVATIRSAWVTETIVVPPVPPQLTLPTVSPAKPVHAKWFTIAGRIGRADPSAKVVKLTIQCKVRGIWKPVSTVSATLAANKTTYSAKTKVARSGTYRVCASHAKDLVHLAGSSAWRTFSAK